MGATGKAEKDVGGPILDVTWKDDGMHVFIVGCTKTVKMWNLQTDQVQDIGSVRFDTPCHGMVHTQSRARCSCCAIVAKVLALLG